MIKQFFSLNTRLSQKLSEKFPTLFGNAAQRYVDMENTINNYNLSDMEVLEVGGVDRPLLTKKMAKNFVGLDVDDHSGLAYDRYDRFYKQSVEDEFNGKFDLIYSITLLEHVPNNQKTFKNIFTSLKRSGETVHYFPSKNAPYALILRLINNSMQKKLIKTLFGEEPLSRTGYPTFFNKCSASEIESLLKNIGYDNIEIKCYYRANGYFSWFLPFFVVVSLFESFCKLFNLRLFASGLLVKATKPT